MSVGCPLSYGTVQRDYSMEQSLTLGVARTVWKRHTQPDPFRVMADLESSMRSLETLARTNPMLSGVLLTLHGHVDHAKDCITFLLDSHWVE